MTKINPLNIERIYFLDLISEKISKVRTVIIYICYFNIKNKFQCTHIKIPGYIFFINGTFCIVSVSYTHLFCGTFPNDMFGSACAAMITMGVCGEIAEEKRLKSKTGNATFRTDMIDAVFNITEEQLANKANYEVFRK